MIELIFAALVFYLIQLLLPLTMALLAGDVTLGYLAGPRDTDTQPKISLAAQRAKRAANNMLESLPVFLILCVLAMLHGAAVAELATIWIGLRIVYVLLYCMGISHVRTLVWGGSIACLIGMAAAIV